MVKYEDPSLDPQHSHKKNPVPVIAALDREEVRGLLLAGYQPSTRFSDRYFLRK